jgi:hypothetical protein
VANPVFDMAAVVTSVVRQAETFVTGETSKVGLGIYGTIFAFHLVEGAAELSQRASACRLFAGRFWLRMALVGALLGGYGPIFVGTAMAIQPRVMMSFAASWAEVWVAENQSLQNVRKSESENQDVKYSEVGTSKGGKEDDSWTAKVARYVVDGISTGLGWLLSVIAGLLITVLILMEGFFALGVNMLLLAIGPICVAFAAHEKTEGIFWSFFKAFLVYGLLYMPMLGFACSFGGVIIARITRMAVGSSVAYGDGSDLSVHFMLVIIGPLCALAVVKAAPSILNSLIGAASMGAPGGGGMFAQASGLASAAVQGGRGGGAPLPDVPGADGEGGPDRWGWKGFGGIDGSGGAGEAGKSGEAVSTSTASEVRGE